MPGRKLLVVFACVAALLVMLACGPSDIFGGGDKATATPVVVATTVAAQAATTATPVPAATTVAQAEATPTQAATTEAAATPTESAAPTVESTGEVVLPSMSDTLEGVDTYEVAIDINMTADTADGPTEQHFTITMAADRPNNAQRMVMEGTGEDGTPMSIESVTIGDDSWFSFGEGWMHTKSSDSDSMTDEMSNTFLLMGNDTLDSIADSRLIKKGETVNGIATDHYAFDETNLTTLGDEAFNGTAQGEYWISQDGKYIVKMVMHGEGEITGTEGEQGVMDMTWEMLSLNQPVNIQAPEGFSPEDMIPVMEGALTSGNYMVTADIAMYEVEATQEEVLQWYEDTLTAQGWTQDSQEISDSMSSANYSMDDSTINIMVLPGETAGVVSVMASRG